MLLTQYVIRNILRPLGPPSSAHPGPINGGYKPSSTALVLSLTPSLHTLCDLWQISLTSISLGFATCKTEIIITHSLYIRILWELNEIIHMKCLAWCLGRSMSYVCLSNYKIKLIFSILWGKTHIPPATRNFFQIYLRIPLQTLNALEFPIII